MISKFSVSVLNLQRCSASFVSRLVPFPIKVSSSSSSGILMSSRCWTGGYVGLCCGFGICLGLNFFLFV